MSRVLIPRMQYQPALNGRVGASLNSHGFRNLVYVVRAVSSQSVHPCKSSTFTHIQEPLMPKVLVVVLVTGFRGIQIQDARTQASTLTRTRDTVEFPYTVDSFGVLFPSLR